MAIDPVMYVPTKMDGFRCDVENFWNNKGRRHEVVTGAGRLGQSDKMASRSNDPGRTTTPRIQQRPLSFALFFGNDLILQSTNSTSRAELKIAEEKEERGIAKVCLQRLHGNLQGKLMHNLDSLERSSGNPSSTLLNLNCGLS